MGGWGSGSHRDRGAITDRQLRRLDAKTMRGRGWRDGDELFQSHGQRVEITTTRPPFGGERIWFLCPRCRSRRRVLYGLPERGHGWRCRVCWRLVYASQYQTDIHRADARAARVLRRLGEKPDFGGRPFKPKGMHWRTYDRLLDALDAAEEDKTMAMIALFGGFMARYGPR